MNSLFSIELSQIELNNRSNLKVKSFYYLISFPGVDQIRSKVVQMTDKNHQAIPDAISTEIQKLKYTCPFVEALEHDYLRIDVYTPKKGQDDRPLFLGDCQINLMSLFIGPKDHSFVLQHSPAQPITLKYHCESIEQTELCLTLQKIILTDVKDAALKIICDAPLSKPRKTTADTGSVAADKTLTCVNFNQLKFTSTIAQLNQPVLVIQLSTPSTGLFSSAEGLGQVNLTLDDVYKATKNNGVFECAFSGKRIYKFTIVSKIENLPHFIQSPTGIHECIDSIDQYQNFQQFDVSEDIYDHTPLPYAKIEPNCTIPFLPCTLIEPMKINVKLQTIQLKITGASNASPSLTCIFAGGKPISHKLQQMHKSDFYECTPIEFPAFMSCKPYLFPWQDLLLQYKSNNKIIGVYYISVHNFLSGPTNYDVTFHNIDNQDKTDISINFTSQVESSKLVYCEFSAFTLKGLSDNHDISISMNINKESAARATKYSISSTRVLNFAERLLIPFQYNPSNPKQNEYNFRVKIYKSGSTVIAKNKFYLADFIPLDHLYQKQINLLVMNKSFGASIDLNFTVKFYTNIDYRGFYYDYSQHKDWNYKYDLVDSNNSYSQTPNQQLCYLTFAEKSKEAVNKTSCEAAFSVGWSNKKLPRDINIKVTPDKILIYPADRSELLYEIPYYHIACRYSPRALQFSSPVITFVAAGPTSREAALVIALNSSHSKRKETLRKSVAIPLGGIDESLQKRLNEMFNSPSALPAISEDLIPPKLYFNVCVNDGQVRFINVTCPTCGNHPYDFSPINVCHVICKDCDTMNEVTWSDEAENPHDHEYLCDSCHNGLKITDEPIKICYECNCGAFFSSICPGCDKMHEKHTLFYKLECTSCHALNLACLEGLECQKCHTVLPPFPPDSNAPSLEEGQEQQYTDEYDPNQYDENGNYIGPVDENYDPTQYDEEGNYIGPQI